MRCPRPPRRGRAGKGMAAIWAREGAGELVGWLGEKRGEEAGREGKGGRAGWWNAQEGRGAPGGNNGALSFSLLVPGGKKKGGGWQPVTGEEVN